LLQSEDYSKTKDPVPRYLVVVNIRADHVGGGSLAHEITHAACAYIRIFHSDQAYPGFWDVECVDEHASSLNDPFSPEEDLEERLAYLIGDMVARFWHEFYRRGYDKLPMFSGPKIETDGA